MSHKIYLPSRWKNGAESIGIETTGYLWPNLTLCLFIPCQNFACASSTELYGVLLLNKPCRQSHQYQGRTSGRMLFLLACIHPVMSCRAGWIFHPSTSSGSFGSSKQATPCMQARIMCIQSFYLGIDDCLKVQYPLPTYRTGAVLAGGTQLGKNILECNFNFGLLTWYRLPDFV